MTSSRNPFSIAAGGVKARGVNSFARIVIDLDPRVVQ
jgi:hypothetical protein